jgi:hypothetical protein
MVRGDSYHSGCLRHTTEDQTVTAWDPSQFGLTPFGQIPSNPPAMLLCIYDLWESLVFLSGSDLFLKKISIQLLLPLSHILRSLTSRCLLGSRSE